MLLCHFHIPGQRISQARNQREAGNMQSKPIYCLAYSSILKKDATWSSETSVDFQWTTYRYVPEDRALHSHRCANLKS
jgi:hypothetical protein